jgi:hypothetical protein
MRIRASCCRRRGDAAATLIECLVYFACWVIVTGLAFTVFYRTLTEHQTLSRRTDAFHRALLAGEQWRADIRTATGPIRIVTHDAGGATLHIPQREGEIVYLNTTTNLLKRAQTGDAWADLSGPLKRSRFECDQTERTKAWRWELEIAPGRRPAKLVPLLTFQAGAAADQTP